LPEELAGETVDRAYELSPEGLQFNIPINVSYLTDQNPNDEEGNIRVTLSLLLTTDGDEFVMLDDLETIVDADDNTVTETGTLDHFSSIFVELEKDFFSVDPGISFVEIAGVPDKVVINQIFNVLMTLSILEQHPLFGNRSSRSDLSAVYTDESIPRIIPDNITIMEIINAPAPNILFLTANFDYICESSVPTTGTYQTDINYQYNEFITIQTTTQTLVDRMIKLKKEVECVADTPTPTPTPPPPPLSTPTPTPTPTNIPPPPPLPSPPSIPFPGLLPSVGIEGNYKMVCEELFDMFGIIEGNLSATFFLDVEIEANIFEANDEVIITAHSSLTNEILFQLIGKVIMVTQDGKVIVNGTGSGRLGDPDGADIIVKVENWMFSLNEQGVIEVEDDLRFNFPELLAPGASSLATCTGQFDKPLEGD
jgi:hypothetical protein